MFDKKITMLHSAAQRFSNTKDSNSITAESEFRTNFLDLNKCNSGSLSSFSYDGTDLMTFEDAGTCATEISSRPPSTTSFLTEDFTQHHGSSTACYAAKQTVQHKNNTGINRSVYVMVSGTSFAVPNDAFEKIRSLDWKCDLEGVLHLNVSPATFEVLLGYIVFGTLPAYDTLSKAEYDEFEPMAMALGFYDLIKHFDRSTDPRLRNKANRRQYHRKKYHQGTPIVLNSENASVTSVKLMAVNGKCARFVASLKRKGTNPLKSRGNTKTTHEHWCSSDHVN